MTTVINLIGGPGVGKSTLAADLYVRMKHKHMNVEMVREVAKEWAIEGRKIGPFEQLSILGEQIKKESSLFGKVDYIVTDSPVLLGAFYFDYNHNETFMNVMVKDYYKFAKIYNINFKNYMIPRLHEYEEYGRFESKEQAEEIDTALHFYMACQDYEYSLFGEKNYDTIVESILRELG